MKKDICQLCGEEKKLVEHHIDYGKNIILKLCDSCHKKIHSIKRLIKVPLENPVDIRCSKCDYEWEYKGQNPNQVTCPCCGRKIPVQENIIKELPVIKNKDMIKKIKKELNPSDSKLGDTLK